MNNVSSSGFYLRETTALLFQNCIIVAFVFLFDKQSDFINIAKLAISHMMSTYLFSNLASSIMTATLASMFVCEFFVYFHLFICLFLVCFSYFFPFFLTRFAKI